jgi:hypothetical protein
MLLLTFFIGLWINEKSNLYVIHRWLMWFDASECTRFCFGTFVKTASNAIQKSGCAI